MDFEVHCMSTLHTKLSFFDYDKLKTVLQSVTPLSHMSYCFCLSENSRLECSESHMRLSHMCGACVALRVTRRPDFVRTVLSAFLTLPAHRRNLPLA